jgi:signal transduction histidine kinase
MPFLTQPSHETAPTAGARFDAEVAAVNRIDAVRTVLRVLMQTTGMRVALVARVTDDAWRCCAVMDEINFGLRAGDMTDVTTTFCGVVHKSAAPLLVNHASRDPRFANHPAPKTYGVESYIAVPLRRRNGTPFGVMCALDPKPAALAEDKLEVFRHLADLVGYQLEQEDELDRRDAQLLSAHEAAQLREQLIGIVSHDLRSPLNAITMSAAALVRRDNLDERTRWGLNLILDSADRANRLIRDLLDFTQARMGKALPVRRQPMDIHQVARQVVNEVRLTSPERAIEHFSEGKGHGAWDPDRMAQVLSNLLLNAVQYSPADAPIEVFTRGEDSAVVLSVSNRGPPIPATLLPLLFEPMKRGTPEGTERRSVGLGLFIVDQIVRAHEGHIQVISTEQDGTVFHLRLPRSEKPS